jgi:uncharacterized protein YjlB
MTPETHHFADDGTTPNSPLPVLVYHDDDFHHFHSTAHEVLGITAGHAEVILGPQGSRFEVGPGDVLVLPAATGHRRTASSADLLVVGAYPRDQRWDMRRGDPAEHDEVLANIARVELPDTDPVLGAGGPLVERWAG